MYEDHSNQFNQRRDREKYPVCLFVKALTGAGYKYLVIDADASNNSLSFYLNDSAGLGLTQRRKALHHNKT
ncbi:hypothetical protein TREPR_2063 [Treponema primitia ZAS-2]|uniref:Uncharacterized protein n=1 Tax=Treponema primitia (strain ATCC BAA-887 / DSM 12427 / ZAS-2) TaxID=545694 RepID=F5YJS4_TREPZ|nr:hypothetical protein TREPR_2063 [Treponema primitia ZAS-2]